MKIRDEGRIATAVFVSGNGSNLDVLHRCQAEADWPIRIELVVSDKPTCLAVSRARQANIPVISVRPRDFVSRAAYETVILEALCAYGVEWIVLAGYLRIVGITLLASYEGRMINIHPSLLPAFPGLHAIHDAYEAGVAETGVTVHYVDAGVDTGRIIDQRVVPIEAGASEEELTEKIHAVEHVLYPAVIRRIIGSGSE